MERKMIYWGVGVFVVLAVVFLMSSNNNGDELGDSIPIEKIPDAASANPPQRGDQNPVAPTSTSGSGIVNYQTYNIDYMNDNVKSILVRQAGASGRTAFYLPSSGYVNVTRGTKYGVAWLMQNVNPKVPEGNYFEFTFSPNVESLTDCGVSEKEAQGWIERGWASQGMISGQWREDWNEWYDAMTIYFSFPSDIEPCNVKYDFVLTRDGAAYDSRTLEFNLI